MKKFLKFVFFLLFLAFIGAAFFYAGAWAQENCGNSEGCHFKFSFTIPKDLVGAIDKVFSEGSKALPLSEEPPQPTPAAPEDQPIEIVIPTSVANSPVGVAIAFGDDTYNIIKKLRSYEGLEVLKASTLEVAIASIAESEYYQVACIKGDRIDKYSAPIKSVFRSLDCDSGFITTVRIYTEDKPLD